MQNESNCNHYNRCVCPNSVLWQIFCQKCKGIYVPIHGKIERKYTKIYFKSSIFSAMRGSERMRSVPLDWYRHARHDGHGSRGCMGSCKQYFNGSVDFIGPKCCLNTMSVWYNGPSLSIETLFYFMVT